MNIKRVILLSAVTFLLSVYSFAEGTKEEAGKEGGKINLEFWNYWQGKNAEVLKALITEYEKQKPNVTINNVYIGWGELLPKLQTASAGGKMPDIAAVDLVWMPKLVRSKTLVKLDPFIEKSGVNMKDFYPETLRVSRYESAYYSLPVSTNNLELFYNKDMFKKAGLDAEKPPVTWGELVSHARKLTIRDGSQSGMEVFTQPGEGLTWQAQVYIWQTGADFLNSSNSAPAFNSDGGEKAIGFLVDLIRKYKVAPLAKWGLFGQGKAAMVMDGSWMVGIWAESAPFNWGTARVPIPADGKPATNMGGEQIFIGKTTPKAEAAAWNFIRWLTGKDAQLKWDMETGFMPVRDSVAEDSTYKEWITKKEPRLLPFAVNQKYAHSRPPITNYPEVSDIFSKNVEKAFYGKVTVREALTSAANEIAPMLK